MEEGPAPTERLVEVAVDVAGRPGDQTYTYRVPPEFAGMTTGELVLVEFGRRRALGVVLGEGSAASRAVKPILARVRSDGPLLPPLQLRLARAVAGQYRAPLATVLRTALPPGLLERVQLVAVPVRESAAVAAEASGAELLAAVASHGAGGVPIRSLRSGGSRSVLVRQLRALEDAGALRLEWRLAGAGGGARLERRAALTERGRALASRPPGVTRVGPAEGPNAGTVRRWAEGPLASKQSVGAPGAADSGPPGRIDRETREPRLGPRQEALLRVLATLGPGETAPAAELAAAHGAAALTRLVRRGLVSLSVVAQGRWPMSDHGRAEAGSAPRGEGLSPTQRVAADAIVAAVRERRSKTVLLVGRAGADRMTVYMAAIDAALASGRQALVLVPEIALALPLVNRLRSRSAPDVALLHGGLSEGARANEWRRVRSGAVRVLVGTRGAVLAPLADPGVVIVDEEQDSAYKSDRTPRYQARDVALQLGALAAAPVVLGSATPDVVTFARALAGEIERRDVSDGSTHDPPRVEVVDLRAELAAGNRGLLSRALSAALAALDRASGERAILVINRRGSASVVLCRDCGYVQVCPECRRPLVYHATDAVLRCHYCGASAPLASRCPACGSPRIRYLGGGTERLEREIRVRFPAYRVARLDRDVASQRGAADRVLEALREGALDVLVGTGMVAKGSEVPDVALVGVVSADVAMNLPDPRASERTYQLLAQAVGRAGGALRSGRAIIQTYQPDHPAVVAVRDADPERFYRAELETRRQLGLPPFGHLVKLTVALADRSAAEAEAERVADRLRPRDPAVEVLGPVPAYVARRAGRWRFHVVLRGTAPAAVLDAELGPGWSIDVDPDSLL